MRTALAVGSAERVLPVVEDYFRGKRDILRAAVNMAWSYALGESLEEPEMREIVAKCEGMVDKLYENDEDGSATLYGLNAISFALQSALTPESKMAEQAISFAAGAAQSGDSERGDEHIQEESEWQARALEIALKAPKPRKDMFDELPKNPQWLQRFLARTGD
jgi:hypothetical protein